ncbi:MAG: dihydrolipoyl dehydrogenase [Ruminococcus sp.]|nr:dihydrolipoyl dehydrogenase [Ruminococcus sp.]
MDNFRIIYKILRILERSMELEEFDTSSISAEQLNIPYPLWCRIMKMLVDNDYVTGVSVWNAVDCAYPRVKVTRPEITLKGLEYLQEKTIMQKIYKAAKGFADIIPNI